MKIIRDLGANEDDILIFYLLKQVTKAIGYRRNFIYRSPIGLMISMVQIFKASESDAVGKIGYTAKYVANVKFRSNIDSGGFVLVTVSAGAITEPHKHEKLEEIFVVLSDIKMIIESQEYQLEAGDIVFVAPNEYHSFHASGQSSARLLAIKFPNIKDDRVTME